MQPRPLALLAALAPLTLTGACSFYGTATHWHGRLDPQGKPVFVKTATNIGINLAVVLPVLGNTTMDEMIDVTTAEIAKMESDGVRVIQTSSENYWYGFPPFTWIITPVITEVSMEYNPSPREFGQMDTDQQAAYARAGGGRQEHAEETIADPPQG